MADRCGYEFSEDYYSEGHTCTRRAGHDGPHRTVLTWETRPEDVCQKEGHTLGEWHVYDRERRMFSLRDWKVLPAFEAECSRCGRYEYVGGEPDTTLSDLLWKSLGVDG